MKKWTCLFILLVANAPAFSQIDTSSDTNSNSRYAIHINPLGLLGGGLGMNGEYLFMRQHALFIEGAYVFPLYQKNTGYGAGVHYRFRFHPRMRSNFIGIFYRKTYAESSIPLDRITYDFSYKVHIIGVNYGWRSRFLKTKFDYEYRVGAGAPISKFTWGKKGRPEKIGEMKTRTFEKIYKYSAALDLGFSIGVSF